MMKIYEPLYAPGQQLSEPLSEPLYLANNDFAEWREFRILVDMYRNGLHRNQQYTGLISPKFNLKTGLDAKALYQFVNNNTGADIYLFNPFPHLATISYNVWMQGEYAHPGLVDAGTRLVAASEIYLPVNLDHRHGSGILSFSNYWIANEKFWDSYVGGVLDPIARYLETNTKSDVSRLVYSPTPHTDPAPVLPFIIERLLSTYLHDADMRVAAYKLDPFGACLNDFEREIYTALRHDVSAADELQHFPQALVEKMQFFTKLRQIYFTDIYRISAHPHSSTK